MTVIIISKEPFLVITYKNVTSISFNPETDVVTIVSNGTEVLYNINDIKLMIN